MSEDIGTVDETTTDEVIDSIKDALREIDAFGNLDKPWLDKLKEFDGSLWDFIAELSENVLPAYKIGQAANGHRYSWPVVGRYDDGALRTTTQGMEHLDDCRCTFDPEFVDDGIL